MSENNEKFTRKPRPQKSGEIAEKTLPVSGNSEENESIVAGRNAVAELLRSGRTIDKIFVKDGDREGSIKKIVYEAIEAKIPVLTAGKSKLDKLAPSINHQGVVAIVAEKEYCTIADILAIAKERGENPFVVVADGINDPHNLGALIRVADGAGCHGVIIPKRHSATLTATVSKASAGALAHMAVAKVSNLFAAVEELKRNGLWIYAAEAGGEMYDSSEIITPSAFIFGSEGDGVSRILKENSDFILSIPMLGKVNSLNVSAAAAVILFHARKFFAKN